MKKSTHSDEDKMRLARALLLKWAVNHQRENVGKKFRFVDGCAFLQDFRKFEATCSPMAAATQWSVKIYEDICEYLHLTDLCERLIVYQFIKKAG